MASNTPRFTLTDLIDLVDAVTIRAVRMERLLFLLEDTFNQHDTDNNYEPIVREDTQHALSHAISANLKELRAALDVQLAAAEERGHD